ncbi:oligogalacturonate-specific porin KdgM family protein [Serratia rhizosphaerae]
MKTYYLSKAALLSLIIATGIAQASTLDYRHEYNDGGKNKDRLKLSHLFDSGIKFSMEVKWKEGDRPFSDIRGAGHKESIAYNYAFNDITTITPEFALQSSESNLTYKPAIGFKFNLPENIYTGGKYTYEYTKERKDNPRKEVNKSEVFVGKVTGPVNAKASYVYKRSPDTTLANYKKNDSQYKLLLAYKISKSFSPYMEVANVSGSKKTDERQTRYRLGIKYKF